jgi:hypothetical protein
MPVINSNPVRNTGSDGMGIDDALKRARTAEAITHGQLLIMLRADIQIQTVKKVPTTKRSCPSAASYRVEYLWLLGRIRRLHLRPHLLRCTNCRSFLSNRLGVAIVVLFTLAIRAYVFRRHQSGIVAKRLKLATEVMRPSARLHADEARR